LNLGSYEPLRFTFCYSVFVGSPDLDFGIENVRGPAAVIRRKHFQFIVLYLTIPIPSAPIGHTFHFQTFDPLLGKNERETKMLESLMSGASPAQCVYEHNWAIFYLLDQHLDNVETIMPIFSPQIAQMRLMVDRGREKAGIKK
jgi:hypothetical protein